MWRRMKGEIEEKKIEEIKFESDKIENAIAAHDA